MPATAFMVLVTSGFALLPGGLLLLLSKHIQRQPLSDRGANRLLYGLLVTIAVLIVVMYALEHQVLVLFIDDVIVFSAPLLAVLIAITCLHLSNARTLWTRRTVLILLAYFALIVLVNVWHMQNVMDADSSLFAMLTILGGGLTIGFMWQVTPGKVFWLSLAALIVAMCINNFVYNGVLATWPRWILWVLNVAANIVIPVGLVALAGRVAVHLTDSPRSIHWRIGMAGALVVILMLLLLMVHIVELTLVDGPGDDGTLFPPWILGLSAITVALLLVWMLERRRIAVALWYFVVMLAAIYGFLAVTYSFSQSPEAATTARAAQIDQAILRYFTDNDHYPADLYALMPHYFLTIPDPVLYWDQIWCYEGGSDFYRLGYIYRPPGKTVEATTTYVQGSAGEPPDEHWICDTLLADYFEQWGI